MATLSESSWIPKIEKTTELKAILAAKKAESKAIKIARLTRRAAEAKASRSAKQAEAKAI